jgi:arylsulfatase A-like enzyme
MAMSGFICHDDYLQKTAKLTDEEVGRLFRALMQYHATGVAEDIAGRESIAFDFMREDIDRTEEAYKAKCEKNRNTRLAAIANERQQTSTNVNDCPQKEKEKEKEKEKKKEEELLFARFWDAYPKHTAKAAARKAFDKVNPDAAKVETMLSAIEKQKASAQWQENGGQFIPYPATWLNQNRWEDELPKQTAGNGKTVVAQQYTQRDYTGTKETFDSLYDRLGV